MPRLHNQRAYLKNDPVLPDWRIKCFFARKGHRGAGAASVALRGALKQIADLGVGQVEGYPEDVSRRKATSAFFVQRNAAHV